MATIVKEQYVASEIDSIQIISYLKASGIETGLVINFGAKSLEYRRFINSKRKTQKESV